MKKDDIDPRMCKALNELPHDLGLEAVDKFAMSNLDNVRSKTGFMVSNYFLRPSSKAPSTFTVQSASGETAVIAALLFPIYQHLNLPRVPNGPVCISTCKTLALSLKIA